MTVEQIDTIVALADEYEWACCMAKQAMQDAAYGLGYIDLCQHAYDATIAAKHAYDAFVAQIQLVQLGD